jgi:hypothetical protein
MCRIRPFCGKISGREFHFVREEDPLAKNVVVLVRQEGLGSVAPEDGDFGVDMFDRFLHSLEGQPVKPAAIFLYTTGVKLACAGSRAVFGLKMMAGMGVRIGICRTCLEHYGLLDKVAAGEVLTMSEISRALMDADQVITV